MMLFKTDDCKYFTARHSITLDSVTGTCGWWNLEVCPSFNVRCPRSSLRTMFENNNKKKKRNHRSSSYDFFQSFLGFLFLGDLFTVSSSLFVGSAQQLLLLGESFNFKQHSIHFYISHCISGEHLRSHPDWIQSWISFLPQEDAFQQSHSTLKAGSTAVPLGGCPILLKSATATPILQGD